MNKVRFCAVVFVSLLAIVLLTQAFPGRPKAEPAHDPILFVHGFAETGSMWNNMINRFKADGWTDAELFNMTYDTAQSNVKTASEIKAKVESILQETGAEKVDLITHSMGGLCTRYYIKFLGGRDFVDTWVSLGGPNHGTAIAGLCSSESCVEMRRNSAFLANLNAGDETPGNVAYGTWWSPCDEIIYPQKSVILDGATNTKTGCIEHISLAYSKSVYMQVRDFVAP